LDEVSIDVDAGRHAVNNTANGFSVAFAKSGQSEYLSEGVHNL
jgi:hypothetical protein